MSQAVALNPMTWDFTPLATYKKQTFGLVAVLATPEAIPTYYENLMEEKRKGELCDFIYSIESLRSWTENWDGHGSAKPKSKSIDNALKWGKYIYSLIAETNGDWRRPFISADEEGDVVLEWWYQDRKLTLDITKTDVSFTEIRDADGIPKITMGSLVKADAPSKFRWLILGE